MKIIIVESPSKSKTIESYMGSDYKVVASQGHIRDLSNTGRGGLGIDIPSGFIPRYEIIKGKEKIVADLKKICFDNEVYLATDPDREGEAISWHLASVLGIDISKFNRVEFNEITENAIKEAFKAPRKIDMSLVGSQETRRMLDRIIGFDLSYLLQKKIKTKSAGRVQSSVLKLIVDQDKEINAFKEVPYYQVEAKKDNIKLQLIDEKHKVISFDNITDAEVVKNSLSLDFLLQDEVIKETKRDSKPPLITSTLQQEASNIYGFSADRTMRAAQSLYEGKEVGNIHVGLITYMRTDSVRLSDTFIQSANNYILKNFGKEYLGHAKLQKTKDNVQDAHEAIRPTSLDRDPYSMDKYLTPDERKIYRLIYNRALESLFSSAKYKEHMYLFFNNGYNFKYTGKTLVFPGFLALTKQTEDDEIKPLLDISKLENWHAEEINLLEQFTKPTPRYTEASIVKAMEEKGIGRPSTYAQTINILKLRKYIEIVDKKIYPTDTGKLTIEKLEEYFSEIISPKYTAEMEETLDNIASGKLNNIIELQKFYNKFYPLYLNAKENMSELPPEVLEDICPKCGNHLVKRKGRFGDYVCCANYPECDYKPNKEAILEKGILCPECLKGHIVKRKGKKGFFYACDNYPQCKTIYNYEPVEEYCEICGSVMLKGPQGLVCSNLKKHPENKEEQEEGILCPVCKEGHIVKRTASKGKSKGNIFYACNRYPKCKTIYSYEPTSEHCPLCGSIMLKKDDKLICSNSKCELMNK